MNVGDHFKLHGTVHLLWIITILVALLTGCFILLPNGALVRDYISFASSVSSIILAVVAIFYSIFSNSSFSEMVGSLQSSVERTQASSQLLTTSTSTMAELAEKISLDLSSLEPRFASVESKIEERLPPSGLTQAPYQSNSDIKDQNGLLKVRGTIGIGVSLDVVKRMHETGKAFNSTKAFDTEIWQHYVAGCLALLGSLQPCGIVISRTARDTFFLESLGNLQLGALDEAIASTKPADRMKDLVDNFFELNSNE